MILRPYQQAALADITLAFASGHRRVVLRSPTASGKTVLFAEQTRLWPGSVLIVAHRRELIRQASAKLGRLPHGIIAPGFQRTADRVQVASVQTLARRDVRQFDHIILDECQHAVAGTWLKLLEGQPDARVLGVTATPSRLDGRGLGEVFQYLVEGPQIAGLVADGYLKRTRVFAPPPKFDAASLHTLGGDYRTDEVTAAIDKPGITGDVVEHYRDLVPGQPAVVFCASVAHAEHVAETFAAAGWRSGAVHGALPERDRDRLILGLGTGEIEVLTSCALIDEGLDVPAISVVIDLAPTQSLVKFLQRAGRGMRPAPTSGPGAGIHELTILDHVGNATLRHGLPDAPREWSLEGRPKRGDVAVAVRQCPSCYAAHTPAPVCPACGHVYAVDKAAEAKKLIVRDGTLVEVGLIEALPPLGEQLKEAKTYEDVERIRVQRGYKRGWTMHIMRFKSGGGARPVSNGFDDFGVSAA